MMKNEYKFITNWLLETKNTGGVLLGYILGINWLLSKERERERER